MKLKQWISGFWNSPFIVGAEVSDTTEKGELLSFPTVPGPLLCAPLHTPGGQKLNFMHLQAAWSLPFTLRRLRIYLHQPGIGPADGSDLRAVPRGSLSSWDNVLLKHLCSELIVLGNMWKKNGLNVNHGMIKNDDITTKWKLHWYVMPNLLLQSLGRS